MVNGILLMMEVKHGLFIKMLLKKIFKPMNTLKLKRKEVKEKLASKTKIEEEIDLGKWEKYLIK
jgi:hypothetical protein